ncbi:cbb3-type cytochrome oxidase assembly protein CcoS [Alkalimarinus alittae]|uniref:Cbb3-type cytochrome oxidase assembly protein CcoS n=1 Tax=Alkalimarinus alittae TaxID=2961619 RepID=A0ABY6MXZ0_9ALTE|nr:cbb3-type cytochrome oxidase assembly protein CcoS [Alkalimarinus alittae]UZE94652.1 cbb3-type cytochrome oxidase assembly protein CcoS [Alkalimarinus alittae]
MEILYILIPLSIVLISLAVVIFSWAVKSGQFDDLEGPAHSILFDDDEGMVPSNNSKPEPTVPVCKPNNTD